MIKSEILKYGFFYILSMAKKRKKKVKNKQLDSRHKSEDIDEEIADELSR